MKKVIAAVVVAAVVAGMGLKSYRDRKSLEKACLTAARVVGRQVEGCEVLLSDVGKEIVTALLSKRSDCGDPNNPFWYADCTTAATPREASADAGLIPPAAKAIFSDRAPLSDRARTLDGGPEEEGQENVMPKEYEEGPRQNDALPMPDTMKDADKGGDHPTLNGQEDAGNMEKLIAKAYQEHDKPAPKKAKTLASCVVVGSSPAPRKDRDFCQVSPMLCQKLISSDGAPCLAKKSVTAVAKR